MEGTDSYNPYFTRQLRDHLKALLADATGKQSALELGAGTGPSWITAPLFAKLIATDLSRGMLTVLERRISQLGLTNVVILQQDAYDLHAVELASVDVVYSVGLLETISTISTGCSQRSIACSDRVELWPASRPMETAPGIAYATLSKAASATAARANSRQLAVWIMYCSRSASPPPKSFIGARCDHKCRAG